MSNPQGAAFIPQDHAARQQALDVSRSFIVRAPAGSGKTRLLIARYLSLLATVSAPEEVVAITFTRKAAAEMRERVQAAFAAAGRGGDDLSALAQAVKQRDLALGWGLDQNGSRLAIQTIDSLNASLTRQMPMLSRFGAQPQAVDDPQPLYLEAAGALLAELDISGPVSDDLATLLSHLDNNAGEVIRLIAAMLARRDQWLRNLAHMQDRTGLEAVLRALRANALEELLSAFPEEWKSETLELVRFSGQNFLKSGVDRALSRAESVGALANFPTRGEQDVVAWSALADLLLTKDPGWRKAGGVDARVGFPPASAASGAGEKARNQQMKERVIALLDALRANDRLLAAFVAFRNMPPAQYSDTQYLALAAIVRLLPRATAHLWTTFSRAGQCDFVEIALAALRALGSDEAPTDLALALDHRVQHILIDEFQDTSYTQHELLQKLTRGWSEGDGRTLFIVGDPMQSIYRFREAEVGLFLRAREEGIGSVRLHRLDLEVNFRSRTGVVDWVNRQFSRLMPSDADTHKGEVPYAVSTAAHQDTADGACVQTHWLLQPAASEGEERAVDLRRLEAEQVVSVIVAAQIEDPAQSIAILARNRSHLSEIVPALARAGIAYEAVDIDSLAERPVVQDLLSLTRAIRHLGDRIAWLSLLRGPWCGLNSAQMLSLTDLAVTPSEPLFMVMTDPAQLTKLDAAMAAPVARLVHALEPALARYRREPLREVVECAWLALNGPAALCGDLAAFDDAHSFLNVLEAEAARQSGGSDIVDLGALNDVVSKLFAAPRRLATPGPVVQVMTIHKAKGLEWDVVLVPGLDRAPRTDEKRLLLWQEQVEPSGERALLVAPVRSIGEQDGGDDIYRCVAAIERQKQLRENVRLMYVACTRAVRRLHLFARLQEGVGDSAELASPRAGSLLAAMWPALAEDCSQWAMTQSDAAHAIHARSKAGSPGVSLESPTLIRIPLPQRAPLLPDPVPLRSRPALSPQGTEVAFDWASDVARHIGTVAHAYLQRIAEEGLDVWSAARVSAANEAISVQLDTSGVPRDILAAASDRVQRALISALEDERGRWLLRTRLDARSEWRLSAVEDGEVTSIAIDRSFVDEEGTRWIIDFKTGIHSGADPELFLDNEVERYRGQLEKYARLVRVFDIAAGRAAPIRLGLYFPAMRGWREWEPLASTEA